VYFFALTNKNNNPLLPPPFPKRFTRVLFLALTKDLPLPLPPKEKKICIGVFFIKVFFATKMIPTLV